MDKYEYKVKLAQIEKLVAKKDFVTAAKIADGIDWRKVKSVTTLNMIADIYEENNRLEDCYEILNMVYDRSPIGRRVVYRMTEVATKMHDFEEAIDLYKEFVKLAPHDLSKYILKYQIYRERGSSVTDQITILEEYRSQEYDERWSYELACLYAEAGMVERCVEECDELILWFSEGEYVAKAMELKMKYQELTASQQEKFEHRYDYLKQEAEPVTEVKAEEAAEAASENKEAQSAAEPKAEEDDDTPKVSVINTNKFSTMNLQEELAKGLQMILAQAEEEAAAEAVKEETQEAVADETLEEPAPEKAEEEAAAEVAEEEISETLVEEAEKKAQTQEFIPVKEVIIPRAGEKPLTETAEIKNELLKYVSVPKEPKAEEMYRTEEDGQITLAIGDENILEKQITGQMTIEEILEAWEEKKRQAKVKIDNEGGKREATLFETGEITGLLGDFIPRTPRDVQNIINEIVDEYEEDLEGEVAIVEETVVEPEKIAPIIETPSEENLEDDLPVDIDFAEALENALLEPKEEEKEKKPVSQNTASMLDAIERALAMEMTPMETAGKYLTEEQEKIFAYFTSVNGMKKQLVELLDGDSAYADQENSNIGNLIITGHPGNGKTTLAIDIVKAIQKQRKIKGGKLAKVTGDGLNKKDPESVVRKLGGGALIIESAGSLSDETVEKLSAVMGNMTGGLLVILEDAADEITKLLERNQSFAVKFNRSIDIPIFSNDELVAFGKSYAEEQEYYFDEMAVLALYDCIGVRQTSDHVVNITEVKEFVDDAIDHAEKKSKSFFARFSKKRLDEEGNKLLLEEDFDY